MEKLSLKDRKILYELDLDARQPDSEIAKKVGLSRDSVDYRINKMVEEGYIKRFNMIPNSMKLGFDWYRAFFKFQNLTLEKEKEIIDWLLPKVNYLTKSEGRWDLNTSVFYRDLYEYRDFLSSFRAEYSEYIDEFEFSVITRFYLYHRNYLVGSAEKPAVFDTMGFEEGGKYEYVEIDETDYKILSILTQNARMKTIDIARNIKSTEMVVRYRIRKLIDNGIILSFRALFDAKKLGYLYFKIHFSLHNITAKKRKQMLAYVQQYPNSIYAGEVVGGSDLETHVEVENTDGLYTYINDMRTNFGDMIKSYYFMEYKNEIKWDYLPKMKFI